MNFCDLPPAAQNAIWNALSQTLHGIQLLQGWVCGWWQP